MSRKLEGNGLWDSSRMMLPQHVTAILKHQSQGEKRTRPVLDSQEYELISAAIGESFTDQKEITLILFNEITELEKSGVVVEVDQVQGWLRVKTDEMVQRIYLRDIIGTK